MIKNFYHADQNVPFDHALDLGQNLRHDFLSGDKQMTIPTCNQTAHNADQLDTIMQVIEMALYYPSSEGNYWDDELLPSGD